MSLYAYCSSKKSKNDIVLAKNAVNEDRTKQYYCPNKKCNAILHVNAAKRPYFSANRNNPHLENCIYGKHIGSEIYELEEKNFNFTEAMKRLMKTNYTKRTDKDEKSIAESLGTVKDKRPHTLRQTYLACKIRSCKDTFNGVEIWRMLLDDRSKNFYSKGVWGIHIIELICGNGKWYDRINRKICLKLNTIEKSEYKFILQFTSSKLFGEIESQIWNNKNSVFVVVGDWNKCGNNKFKAIVNSKSQIWQLK